jgi:hypothetical protein
MIVTVPIVFHVAVIPTSVTSMAVIPTLVIRMSIINASIIHMTIIHMTIIAPVCMIEAMIAIIVPLATVAGMFHASFPEFARSSGCGNGGPPVVRGSKELAVAPGLALVIPLLV